MRYLLLLVFVSSCLFAMGERIDYSVDELTRLPVKQRPAAAAPFFTRSVAHWKEEARVKGPTMTERVPSIDVAAIRKIKKIAVVGVDVGIRIEPSRNCIVDWSESDLLTSQCLQTVGASLRLAGFSVASVDVVSRLLSIEPDWTPDIKNISSNEIQRQGFGGTWMRWPVWIEKPNFAKDRAIRLMDVLGVDGLVWVSLRGALSRNGLQQASFSATPYYFGDWRQREFEGRSDWTHLGVEMTLMTRKGVASGRLVSWSNATKGDWLCPAIEMNVKPLDLPHADYRLSWSRYPLVASFRVLMETMGAMLRADSIR